MVAALAAAQLNRALRALARSPIPYLGEAIELVEPLRQPDSAPLQHEAAFDEFFLEFTLYYQGLALTMGAQRRTQVGE